MRRGSRRVDVFERSQEGAMLKQLCSTRGIGRMSKIVVAMALGFSLAVAVGAQTPPEGAAKPAAKPVQPPDMHKAMEAMGPMMGQMMSSMLDGMLVVLAKPETAQRTATFSRNYYDALIAKGFSNEDALRIVMAHGIPMPGGR
jgi:hypothetical protein